MARTYWGDGSQWAPAAFPGATGYWGSAVATSDGVPELRASVGGVLQRLTAAQWRIGRPGWFAELEPTAATLSIVGGSSAVRGDPVIIRSDRGVHWQGTVTSVTTTEVVGGDITSTIAASDLLAALGDAVGDASPAGVDLSGTIEAILDAAGVAIPTITYAPSNTTTPDPMNMIWSDTPYMDMLRTVERSANALIVPGPTSWTILIRGSLPASSVAAVVLDGDDAPSSWTTQTGDPGSIINHWLLVQSAGSTVILDTEDAASIALYGRHTFEELDYADNDAAHFTAGMRASMAVLRTTVPAAVFPVRDYGQSAPWLVPLDWVERDGTLYQILEIAHDVQIGSSWTVSMFLDSTQSQIDDDVDPDPDPDPDPTVTLVEQTYIANRDTVVVRKSGNDLGAGKGDYLHVGFYDGARARTLLHFPMTASGAALGATGVRKATLRLRTSTQHDYAFGSNPKVVVQRITSDWTEGSYDPASGADWSSTNATVWPGPSTTTAGQVVKEITTSESTWTTYVVTTIARAHFDSGDPGGDGYRVRALNEDWHGNATEYSSRETANEPELVVMWEVPV